MPDAATPWRAQSERRNRQRKTSRSWARSPRDVAFQGVAADPGQIRHRPGTDKIGVAEMLRCAKDLGLKARAYRTDWSRLARTPLPAIAALRDGGFLVVAQAT